MLSSFFFSVASFVVVIGVLIIVHEFGHFWVARRLGVKVIRYSIGFGKPLWKWQRDPDDTEYVVAAVPLGGYVKMLDEREGEVPEDQLHRAFNRKPLASRFAIVAAGPVFNFLFAVVAYWVMFVVGVSGLKPIVDEVEPGSVAERAGLQRGDEIVAVNGERTPTWNTVVLAVLDKVVADEPDADVRVVDRARREQLRTLELGGLSQDLGRGSLLVELGIRPVRPAVPPVIGQVLSGGPAERAGLQAGDRLLSARGTEIGDWRDWVVYVRERPGETIPITVLRDGQRVRLDVRPEPKKDGSKTIGYIGAAVQEAESAPESLRAVLQYPPGKAFLRSLKKTWQISALTVRMLGKMVVGEASVENISGPITIARYAGHSAAIGLAQFMAFLAIVSISLGIINLLPIPLLDGGHLMYYVVELVKGSPVSERSQVVGQRVGILILALLMALAFYNDLLRLLR